LYRPLGVQRLKNDSNFYNERLHLIVRWTY